MQHSVICYDVYKQIKGMYLEGRTSNLIEVIFPNLTVLRKTKKYFCDYGRCPG